MTWNTNKSVSLWRPCAGLQFFHFSRQYWGRMLHPKHVDFYLDCSVEPEDSLNHFCLSIRSWNWLITIQLPWPRYCFVIQHCLHILTHWLCARGSQSTLTPITLCHQTAARAIDWHLSDRGLVMSEMMRRLLTRLCVWKSGRRGGFGGFAWILVLTWW